MWHMSKCAGKNFISTKTAVLIPYTTITHFTHNHSAQSDQLPVTRTYSTGLRDYIIVGSVPVPVIHKLPEVKNCWFWPKFNLK